MLGFAMARGVLESSVWGLGSGGLGVGFRVSGLVFRVSGSGLKVEGSVLRVLKERQGRARYGTSSGEANRIPAYTSFDSYQVDGLVTGLRRGKVECNHPRS
jgi:hypothetical protein